MRALVGIAILLTVTVPAIAQDNRRDREEPELVVESGGRTGTCDALLFSDDGQLLFAVGDDKVVRVWPNGKDGLDGSKMQTLRWPSWREQRGGIKALAVSPDGEHVLVGGYGLRASTVALLNRKTGEIEELTYPESKLGENFFAVMAAAFSPDGKSMAFGTGDGSVWLWRKGEKPKRIGKQIAKFPDGKTAEYNFIRLVAFLKSGRILSVARTGQIQSWAIDGFVETAEDRGKMIAGGGENSPVFRATLSRDQEWLAVGGNDAEIVIYNLRTKAKKSLKLQPREFVRAIAFDHDADRLAVAIGSVPNGTKFSLDADDRIFLIDNPRSAEKLVLTPGPKHSFRAEALAFDPAGRLAIAGGDNHEVTLWDHKKSDKPASTIRGSGRNLWGARISAAGTSIAFQQERDAASLDPNKRGKGAYVAFDLTRCKPLKADAEWVEPLTTADGWTVAPHPANRFIWFAENVAKGVKLVLPLNPDRDEAPRCFAFLPASKDNPTTRLIVGHYYGCSLYDLLDQKAVRRFVYVGHAGEVMSIAPSKDHKWFITCGTDQTIAGWSAEDWKNNPKTGADFAVENGKLIVKKLAIGSPFWEAGLIEGDEIVLMVIGGDKPFFNRSGMYTGNYGPPTGSPEDGLKKLNDPTPGINLHLGWKSNGKLREQVTSMPRRPLWRMFPSFDQKNGLADWIVWMWKNSCYHTSTNGDFLVGWHVNSPTMDATPKFYRAEQFREHFHKPQVVMPLLTDRNLEDAISRAIKIVKFNAIEPDPVTIEPREPKVGPNGLELTLKVNIRGSNPDRIPQSIVLWVNDFRLDPWVPGDTDFEKKVVIPADKLRDGNNQITLQTFNRLGGRGEAVVMAEAKHDTTDRNLFGEFVGVNQYANSKVVNPDGGRAFGDLKSAVNDARQLHDRWLEQLGKDRLFRAGRAETILDVDVKKQSILDALDIIAKKAKPDDLLILFLSGHGDFIRPPVEKGRDPKPGVFVFCCPDYDRKEHDTTGISTELLVEKLSKIRCRKLVLLDACHSGEAASTNLVRRMAPNATGLTVMAACDQQEQAFEHEKYKNGLFTYAVLEALGPKFDAADVNPKNGVLTPGKLFRYVKGRIPELLKDIGKDEFDQNPICFPREPEKYPVGTKK